MHEISLAKKAYKLAFPQDHKKHSYKNYESMRVMHQRLMLISHEAMQVQYSVQMCNWTYKKSTDFCVMTFMADAWEKFFPIISLLQYNGCWVKLYLMQLAS